MFQGFDRSAMVLAMLFARGVSDDLRFAYMGMAVDMFTKLPLAALGIDDDIELGPVTARDEYVRALQERGPSG